MYDKVCSKTIIFISLKNMIKHKLLLLGILTSGTITIKAQDAVPAAGGDAAGTGGSVAYSVGQVVYTTSNGTGSVNQGVQQPYTLLATGLNDHPDVNLSFSAYPNPAVNYLNLNVGKQDLKNLSFQLFDVQGKLLLTKKINTAETSIKMEEYNSGNYFLKVISNSSELKTFTIIKN
jgi:hypothetical protein